VAPVEGPLNIWCSAREKPQWIWFGLQSGDKDLDFAFGDRIGVHHLEMNAGCQ
jgi:hypothetical protein